MFGSFVQAAKSKAEEVRQSLVQGSKDLISSLAAPRRNAIEEIETNWIPKIKNIQNGNDATNILNEWISILESEENKFKILKENFSVVSSTSSFSSSSSSVDQSDNKSESHTNTFDMYHSLNHRMGITIGHNDSELMTELGEYLRRESLSVPSAPNADSKVILEVLNSVDAENLLVQNGLALTFKEGLIFTDAFDLFIDKFTSLPISQRSMLANSQTVQKESKVKISSPKHINNNKLKNKNEEIDIIIPSPSTSTTGSSNSSSTQQPISSTATPSSSESVLFPSLHQESNTSTGPSLMLSPSPQQSMNDLTTGQILLQAEIDKGLVSPSQLLDKLLKSMLVPMKNADRKNLSVLLLALPHADDPSCTSEGPLLTLVSLIKYLKREWKLEFLQREIMQTTKLLVSIEQQVPAVETSNSRSTSQENIQDSVQDKGDNESTTTTTTSSVNETIRDRSLSNGNLDAIPVDWLIYHSVHTSRQRKLLSLVKREVLLAEYLRLCNRMVDILIKRSQTRRADMVQSKLTKVSDQVSFYESSEFTSEADRKVASAGESRNSELTSLAVLLDETKTKKSEINSQRAEITSRIEKLKEELEQAQALLSVNDQQQMELSEEMKRVSDLMDNVELTFSDTKTSVKKSLEDQKSLIQDFKSLQKMMNEIITLSSNDKSPRHSETTKEKNMQIACDSGSLSQESLSSSLPLSVLSDEIHLDFVEDSQLSITSKIHNKVLSNFASVCFQKSEFLVSFCERLSKVTAENLEKKKKTVEELASSESQLKQTELTTDVREMVLVRISALEKDYQTAGDNLMQYRSLFGRLLNSTDEVIRSCHSLTARHVSKDEIAKIRANCVKCRKICVAQLNK